MNLFSIFIEKNFIFTCIIESIIIFHKFYCVIICYLCTSESQIKKKEKSLIKP